MPWIIPASALGGNGAVAPSERINVGLIGRGAMGSGHLHVLAGHKETQLVAVCDVDRVRREDGARQADETCAAQRGTDKYPHCAAINDYRELLARPDIDAVLIATPDHWHSLLSIHAAQAGKDVYCEKPVSLTIREGRDMVNTIRRYARVFQTGTQYRSIPTIRQVCEFVRGGGLGKVKSVFTIWMKTHVPTVGPSDVPLHGGLFVGERGWITSMSGSGPVEGGPEGILREMSLTTRQVNIGANNHHANWFECIRSRLRPSAHEEIGHRSASLGQLVALLACHAKRIG